MLYFFELYVERKSFSLVNYNILFLFIPISSIIIKIIRIILVDINACKHWNFLLVKIIEPSINKNNNHPNIFDIGIEFTTFLTFIFVCFYRIYFFTL